MNNKQVNRCIFIFPHFDNLSEINSVRKKYDPNYLFIDPHITLVFPFISSIPKIDISQHLDKCLIGFSSFPLSMAEITLIDNEFIFLLPDKGKKELMDLNKTLYSGILLEYKPNWLYTNQFIPHLTVGKLNHNNIDTENVIDNIRSELTSYNGIINKVSVEIIDPHTQYSIIEIEKNI